MYTAPKLCSLLYGVDSFLFTCQILGKVFIIHEDQDDLGSGGDEGSEVMLIHLSSYNGQTDIIMIITI